MNDSVKSKNNLLENCQTGLLDEQAVCVLPANVTDTISNNPTVRVLVDGLSIFYFSPERKRAELGFLKDKHLDIEMKIYQRGKCTPIWTTENINTQKCTITVNSTRTTEMGNRYQTDADETSAHLPDDRDFRHIPNLAKWHGKQCLDILATAKDALSARLNIHGATFFTFEKSHNHAHRIRTKIDNLYNIGRIIGGNISIPRNETVMVQIKLQDGSLVDAPPLNGVLKYDIVIRNVTNDHTNHFPLLYKVCDKKGDDEFKLQFVPEEGHWEYCKDNGTHHETGSTETHDNGGHHSDEDVKQDVSMDKDADQGIPMPGVTEYACQAIIGGCGNLPDIP